jgi:multidrug efflux pump subunit AcrA (membrane-fusion protein)
MSAPSSGTPSRSALDDLEVLQRTVATSPKQRRPLLPRILVALLILGLLAALYGTVVDPLLHPAREVRTAAVRPVEGAAATARRALARAAGWLEADPYPITVRPLVDGVVARLEVLEGQRVEAGKTVIAVLENPELVNALAEAESEVKARRARVEVARESAAVAARLLEQKLELRDALLAAEIEARRDRESLKEAEAALALAEANLAKAAVELDAQVQLAGSGSTPPISARVAAQTHRAALAERDMRAAARERARVEVDVHDRSLLLAEEALREPKALEGAAKLASQELLAAEAEHALAVTRRDVAKGNVERLTVRAPASGVVLRLLAAPGAPAGPQGDMRESSTLGPGSTGALDAATGALALLYDPARLQARVEVPLSDLSGLGEGGEVSLEIEAVPGRTFAGRVTRLLGEANVQNNKLWVKVRLTESDALLKPEMLARVQFLAPPTAPGAEAAGQPRLEVPVAALAQDAVFVLDPTKGGRARRVPVVRRGESGGWVEVEGRLGLSNEVILEPQGLEDGARVKVMR